jgi:two-component system sensor histidine kinase CpxA
VRNRFAPGRHDFFSRSLSLQVSDARYAYETGGRAALQEYIARLDQFFPGSHALVNSQGIDLVTGKDRSAELKRVGPHWSPATQSRMAIAWPSRDGNYRLVIDSPSPPGPWSPIPFYLWIFVATVVFCYVLAVQLASPLKLLGQMVERFGRGDLQARADSKRKDEFGNLARAFNLMADRIEMLLTAERRLLQDVSHELRSPLARLKFAIELARTSRDQQTALDRIEKEVDRLSSLVSELLQVTRAESDPESRNMDELALSNLLRELVEDSSVECAAHSCRITLSASEPLVVRGDRELLRRAVENVLRNAIRYAPAGTPIEIKLERRGEAGVISIRDYGPGVPEESLSRLFKPFFRAEPDRNRNSGGGVGLGLSIAQRAVAVHGGTIRAWNAHPGLEVEISVPAIAAAALVEA